MQQQQNSDYNSEPAAREQLASPPLPSGTVSTSRPGWWNARAGAQWRRFYDWSTSASFIGYLLAVLGQVLAVLAMAATLRAFPTFRFPEALVILVVVLISLGWGTGPGIIATLSGSILQIYLLLSPYYSFTLARSEDAVAAGLYTLIGLAISVMAGQAQRARLQADERTRQEERYRIIVQTANEGIWLVDRAAQTLYGNERLAEMLGVRATELPGLNILEFVYPEDRAEGRARMRNNLHGQQEHFEFRWRRRDGRPLYTQVATSPVRDENGASVSVLGLLTDITTRRLTEQALQLSEERLRVALKNSSITVYQQDQNLRYTWMSNPLSAFTSLDIVGKTDLDFVLPEEAEHLTELKRRVLTTGQGVRAEVYTTSDAGARILELTIEPIREDSGAITGVTGTAIDITARKQAEEERTQLLARAQHSEFRFQRLFEANLIGLLIADQERIIEANDAFLDMVGYSRSELESGQLRWQEMTPREYQLKNEQAVKDLTQRGECPPFDEEYLRKDGSRVPILIGAVVVERTPLRWISFVLDLSERKQLEQKARDRARELETLFEAMTDGVIVFDAKGGIRQLNSAARAQLDKYIPPESWLGSARERAEYVAPRSPEGKPLRPEQMPVLRFLEGETINGADAADVLISTFKGEELWLNMSGAPLRDEQGQIVGAISLARDVTERRKLEQRTRKALAALLEMAQVIVRGSDQEDHDTNNSTTRARQVMQRMAELTREVLGCQRLSFIHVEPQTELLRPLAVVGLPPEQEQQWWREQEQQEIHLSVGPDHSLVDRLRANEVLVMDLTLPPYNDQPNPYGVKQMLVAPMALGGRLLGYLTLDYGGLDHTYTPEEVALTRAVTELTALAMERDRLLAETAMARANELAATSANRLKDEFIGIASHELRTPLTSMKGNLQLAQRQLRRILAHNPGEMSHALDQVLASLQRTSRQIERQNRLVQDLLEASRLETGSFELRPTTFDLVALIQEVVEDQQEVTPTRTIAVELPATRPLVVAADHDRLSQVVSNYLSNALKYSEDDKPVAIRLEVLAGAAKVAVRDHGPGLPPEELQHIWERFYRVPGVAVISGSGIGLGLGLHISHMIVKRHKGDVGVESEPGQGSTFWFTLPLDHQTDGSAQQS